MSSDRDSVRSARRATRSFLVYQAEGPPTLAPDDPPAAPVGLRRLSREFPEARIGRALMEAARTRLQTESRFAVVFLRMTDFAELRRESRASAASLLLDVAAALAEGGQIGDAPWGLVEQDMFGLFLPEADAHDGRTAADRVRAALEVVRPHPLAAGVAPHPFPGFRRPQTFSNARKALDHAELLGPGRTAVFGPVSLHISGDRRYQRGDIRGAIAEFKQALALAPEDPNLLNSLGVCYGVRGALDAALNSFEESARRDPTEMMPVYNAGVVHRLRGEPQAALECFEAAIRIGGIVFEAVFQAGRLYLETGRPEAARERFHTATELRPRSGTARRFLADAFLALNRPGDALAALREAVRRNPQDAMAFSALGELMDLRDEDPDIALLYCRHGVELAPENGHCHRRLGDACLRRGRTNEALSAYETAARLGIDCDDPIDQLKAERASNVS